MSSPKYLVDVNLPYYFSKWNNPHFIHQLDLGDEWSDAQIWEYTKENNLTIITKDTDFSNRMVLHTPPPRVIHIRFGNVRMKEFFVLISKLWPTIEEMSTRYKIVNVFKDRIEGIE